MWIKIPEMYLETHIFNLFLISYWVISMYYLELTDFPWHVKARQRRIIVITLKSFSYFAFFFITIKLYACAGNWNPVLWKSSNHTWPVSHVSSLSDVFTRKLFDSWLFRRAISQNQNIFYTQWIFVIDTWGKNNSSAFSALCTWGTGKSRGHSAWKQTDLISATKEPKSQSTLEIIYKKCGEGLGFNFSEETWLHTVWHFILVN